MLKEKDAVVRKAMILIDGITISIAFFLAYLLRQNLRVFYRFDLIPSSQVVSDTVASLSEYLIILFVFVPIWCFMLHLNGLYRSTRTRKFFELLWMIIKSAALTGLILSTFVFLFRMGFVSRIFFVFFMMFGSLFLIVERIAVFSVMQYARKRGYNHRRLLIVGSGRRASGIIDKINIHPEWGFKIIGAVNDDPSREVKMENGTKIIGTIDDFKEILQEDAIDQVVFVVPRSRLNYIEDAVNTCETLGTKATIAVDLFDLKIAKSNPTELDGIPLITFETTVAKEWQLFIKRGLDLIISGLSIFIFAPFLFITSILIKLTSSGPIIYKQHRLGLSGRKFELFKFRTMYLGAQEVLSKVKDVREKDAPDFRKRKIQLITPVGRLLRKFSLDELPQLFNVFTGQMSLIGPRPTVPDEVSLYESWQRRRFSMKPGITCLWQVKGRNKIGFEEWMKLDLEYLDNWSLRLDFKILIKTIPVVLFGIGAY
ncbi:MAG: sugar transferase [Candidatus Hodarchaeales archaeon]|jgi:exopolysaccharide biosynthesis polyprenyl glycosylphosphotransferase